MINSTMPDLQKLITESREMQQEEILLKQEKSVRATIRTLITRGLSPAEERIMLPIWRSLVRKRTEVGVKDNQDTSLPEYTLFNDYITKRLIKRTVQTEWHGYKLPPGINAIGDEVLHSINGEKYWSCWWQKDNKYKSVTLEGNLPPEDIRILFLTTLRLTDADNST